MQLYNDPMARGYNGTIIQWHVGAVARQCTGGLVAMVVQSVAAFALHAEG